MKARPTPNLCSWATNKMFVTTAEIAQILREQHYLGPISRGIAWQDKYGVMVLSSPTSRRLPTVTWLEISRWCLYGEKNGGSRQWKSVRHSLKRFFSHVTTVVS